MVSSNIAYSSIIPAGAIPDLCGKCGWLQNHYVDAWITESDLNKIYFLLTNYG